MSQTPNKEQLYRMAVEAVKNGQKQPARMMFQQVLQVDGRDTLAMMWLAQIADSQDERADWLRRVLKIDPRNANAKKALSKIVTHDTASRNRLYFRLGALGYAILVVLVSVVSIFAFSG
jgi:hypothetical protein